jgi:hypothetical protein
MNYILNGLGNNRVGYIANTEGLGNGLKLWVKKMYLIDEKEIKHQDYCLSLFF